MTQIGLMVASAATAAAIFGAGVGVGALVVHVRVEQVASAPAQAVQSAPAATPQNDPAPRPGFRSPAAAPTFALPRP